MTSRERVRKLFRGETDGGMVIDFGGMPSDGISAVAYAKLLRLLGLENRPVKVYDIFQQLAKPDLDVVNRLGGDFILAHRMRPRFGISCKDWIPGALTDGTPCLVPAEFHPTENEDGSKSIFWNGRLFARMPHGGLYFDQIYHPLEAAESPGDLAGFHPDELREDEVNFIADEVEALYETTDKAIVYATGISIFEQGQRDFGFESYYCNLAAEPELMSAYAEKLTEAALRGLTAVLGRVGGKLDVVQFFDDLGTQKSLQISPEMYRALIKPWHTKLFSAVHALCPHIKVLLHSCGAIFELIPDLLESGVDLLNPVQISADGMDPVRLKAAYGDRLVFWGGGADMQGFAANASISETRAHVRGLVEAFARGGNYIFSQVHNFQHDIPPEKILAIFETALEFKAGYAAASAANQVVKEWHL